ncbi:FAD-dependent oxidoreductase [Aequorivita sp. SDUM287046]|uniref:FAD-dependent oxidoreductase n=1 Tax=Aequorivita aurantiaca TaxID=3053356 RepID=A0ABT8DH12_9FLAO|nr:FAD-dependent oxidoreductase [Aequorivita aurantiaca]MDN3724137.1 FAD-dependent oxidoreductase [Aequorivita aurantiaca]
METKPIWSEKSIKTNFPQLNKNIRVDVAIIGAGITGITTAEQLKKHGHKIAVLESRAVGKGTSGQSTGNLYAVTEYPNYEIEEKYDLETVNKVVQSRKAALDYITNNISQFNIDCDFQERSMFIFENDGDIDFDKEKSVAQKIGLPFTALKNGRIPFNFNEGIEYPNQAQFNPLLYIQHMAKHLHDEKCSIYENTRVLEIDEKDEHIILKTETATVTANYVIHATHTPMGLHIQYHTTLGPYREYGIGVKLRNNQYPEGIFWGHFENKKYSVRSYILNDEPYLLCIGSMHKVGQAKDNKEHIRELETFVKHHFEVERITHRWGGQNYKSADLLPYIGQKSAGSKQYIATGFSTDGLIYGALAGMLLADEINEKKNPFAELYKASRHQPLKAASKFAKENLNVAAQLIKDFSMPGFDSKDVDLELGEGKIVQVDGKKMAIHKDEIGSITKLSAICPHMGCTVHWNNAEKSWDCPCHGSRFDAAGCVIEGPAFHGLAKIK